jgi:hypothetical protein
VFTVEAHVRPVEIAVEAVGPPTLLEGGEQRAATLTLTLRRLGLYGFAYQSRVGSPGLWKATFVLLVAVWLWNLFAPKNQAIVDKFGAGKGGAALSLMLMLAVPELVGIYLYGFRSPGLWK